MPYRVKKKPYTKDGKPVLRDTNGKFCRGTCGGPGNPTLKRFSEGRRLLRDFVTDKDLELAYRKLMELIGEGNPYAIKEFWNRVGGTPKPEKGDPISISLPELKDSKSAIRIGREVLKAMSEGKLTPEEAQKVSSILADFTKSIESLELLPRIRELERDRKNEPS